MTWNLKANWTLFALLACLIVAGVIYGLAITPFVGDGYDDAHYITLAQSLAQGKGYRHLAAPGAPPEVKYPPGWPMLLALVWWLFPDFPANAVWFKAVSAMFAIGFATVMYGWLRWRNEAAVKSLFIALLTLFSPHLLGLGTTAFSEMAFGFFSLLALWLVAVWMKRPTPHIGRTILTALVVAFTLYLRMFGLALITAVLFYVWHKRRNRDALILTLLIIGLILPLLSRLLPSSPYLNEFTLKSMEHATLGRASIIDFLLRILNNLRAYLLAGIPGAVLPSQVPLTYVNMPAALHLGRPWPGVDILLSVMVSGGVIGQILLRRSLSDWYVAFYLGMALLWPWEPTRFMVPLIPLMIEYFWFEVSILGQVLLGKRRQWRHRFRRLVFGGIALFIAANMMVQSLFAFEVHRRPPSLAWQAQYRLYEWITVHTRERDTLAGLPDFQLYLYTGHPVLRDLSSAESFAENDVKYVVLIPSGGVQVGGDLSRLRFDPVLTDYPDAFTQVYTDESAGIEVFRVDRKHLP